MSKCYGINAVFLNKLISKIEIGCLETVDGEKQQEISVEWKIESDH